MEESSNTLGDSQQERKCSIGWRLKIQALSETRGLYGRMTSIKECFVILLSPWQSEDSRTFSKKAAIKQEQEDSKKTVSDNWVGFTLEY